jgi:hypothetical protein
MVHRIHGNRITFLWKGSLASVAEGYLPLVAGQMSCLSLSSQRGRRLHLPIPPILQQKTGLPIILVIWKCRLVGTQFCPLGARGYGSALRPFFPPSPCWNSRRAAHLGPLLIRAKARRNLTPETSQHVVEQEEPRQEFG